MGPNINGKLRNSSTEQQIYTLLEKLSQPRKAASTAYFTALMDMLGNPHEKLPPVVHIAGTNGKGSVIAYINSILKQAGYQVHATTSPHLVSVCERIQLSNQQIEAPQFLDILREIQPYLDELPLTYFEIITAVAFLLFSRIPADFVLLETGMGGTYDATNVVENPIATGITRIAYDHLDRLGDTLTAIAYEKAGIIKPNIPIVTIQQEPEAMEVINSSAKSKQAPLYIVNPISNYQLALAGDHQKENAAIALEIIRIIGGNIPDNEIAIGFKKAYWPGRMQKLVVGTHEVWLDIAHNESGAYKTVSTLSQMGIGHFHLAFSIKSNKDIKSFLLPFKGSCISVTYIPLPPHASGATYDEVLKASAILGIEVKYVEDVCSLLDKFAEPLLITGSAVLVGQVLAILKTIYSS